jgi:hypothetical protein
MPVVFREGGLSYYFFSNEGSPREPVHIHVRGGGRDAKIWVKPEIAVADSYGFSSGELARILDTIARHRPLIVKAWHEHFSEGRSF